MFGLMGSINLDSVLTISVLTTKSYNTLFCCVMHYLLESFPFFFWKLNWWYCFSASAKNTIMNKKMVEERTRIHTNKK